MPDKKLTKIVTNEVRVSYCNLLKPRENKLNGNTEYSAELWIPKSTEKGKETLKKIITGMDAAVETKFDKKPAIKKRYAEAKSNFLDSGDAGVSRETFHFPIKDADVAVKEDDKTGEEKTLAEFQPECKGHYIVRVKAYEDNPPKIIDGMKNEILDDKEVKSGDYMKISMNAWAFDNQSKGVSFFINGGQFIRAGEALGSENKVEDDFEEITEEDWG